MIVYTLILKQTPLYLRMNRLVYHEHKYANIPGLSDFPWALEGLVWSSWDCGIEQKNWSFVLAQSMFYTAQHKHKRYNFTQKAKFHLKIDRIVDCEIGRDCEDQAQPLKGGLFFKISETVILNKHPNKAVSLFLQILLSERCC